ncbi:YlxM family DNA-binding protein [Inediibacterium massiliense]|uniref:YlxM family DNA-binding protein n=1 Tax=Inediibacterium massiliense TaxID=1658111 RepID=UPI0006B4F272|nr:putative DNA-binding protein [Inediibacterium massiliense]
MFDKILQMSLLYDFYGQLLTKKQQEILELYYGNDFSLGEISEELGVSRQAIYDTIKRTEKLLFAYEEKLGLLKKFLLNKKQVEEILSIVEKIEKNENIQSSISYIEEEIETIKKLSYAILEK